MPNVDPRIKRFYVYSYLGDQKAGKGFDSGLADFRFPTVGTNANGFALRRMYCTVQAVTVKPTDPNVQTVPCVFNADTETDTDERPATTPPLAP